jgi:single-strand DNA-binding protein
MFDTYVTLVGNALNNPERRTTTKTNAVVVTLRVAGHPRRFDRTTQQWVDSDGLRIKVNCWRRLGDHVYTSVRSGDPVVVHGRIATREWKTEQGETRYSYELDADTVGHDLSRGTATFTKARTDLSTTVIEDGESESRVNGELAEPMPGDEDTVQDSFDEYTYQIGKPGSPEVDSDSFAILRGAGLDGAGAGDSDAGGDGSDDPDEEAMAGADAGSGGSSGRSRRRGRQPVPA